MKAEHINPFVLFVSKIMKDMCMIDITIGKPSMRSSAFAADDSLIKLGLVGSIQGEVILVFNHQTALGIVSKMMMMPVQTIDEIGQSALSELGNMVAGNAATVFANNGTAVDITPPAYGLGDSYTGNPNILFSIPFSSEVGEITVEVFIKD